MENCENLFADHRLKLKEIYSSIKIMKYALQNNDGTIEECDIDNLLEILSLCVTSLIDESSILADKMFLE